MTIMVTVSELLSVSTEATEKKNIDVGGFSNGTIHNSITHHHTIHYSITHYICSVFI